MKPHDKDILKSQLSVLQKMADQIDQLVNAAKNQAGAPEAAIQTMSSALLMQKDLILKTLKFIGEIIDKV